MNLTLAQMKKKKKEDLIFRVPHVGEEEDIEKERDWEFGKSSYGKWTNVENWRTTFDTESFNSDKGLHVALEGRRI